MKDIQLRMEREDWCALPAGHHCLARVNPDVGVRKLLQLSDCEGLRSAIVDPHQPPLLHVVPGQRVNLSAGSDQLRDASERRVSDSGIEPLDGGPVERLLEEPEVVHAAGGLAYESLEQH